MARLDAIGVTDGVHAAFEALSWAEPPAINNVADTIVTSDTNGHADGDEGCINHGTGTPLRGRCSLYGREGR